MLLTLLQLEGFCRRQRAKGGVFGKHTKCRPLHLDKLASLSLLVHVQNPAPYHSPGVPRLSLALYLCRPVRSALSAAEAVSLASSMDAATLAAASQPRSICRQCIPVPIAKPRSAADEALGPDLPFIIQCRTM